MNSWQRLSKESINSLFLQVLVGLQGCAGVAVRSLVDFPVLRVPLADHHVWGIAQRSHGETYGGHGVTSLGICVWCCLWSFFRPATDDSRVDRPRAGFRKYSLRFLQVSEFRSLDLFSGFSTVFPERRFAS